MPKIKLLNEIQEILLFQKYFGLNIFMHLFFKYCNILVSLPLNHTDQDKEKINNFLKFFFEIMNTPIYKNNNKRSNSYFFYIEELIKKYNKLKARPNQFFLSDIFKYFISNKLLLSNYHITLSRYPGIYCNIRIPKQNQLNNVNLVINFLLQNYLDKLNLDKKNDNLEKEEKINKFIKNSIFFKELLKYFLNREYDTNLSNENLSNYKKELISKYNNLLKEINSDEIKKNINYEYFKNKYSDPEYLNNPKKFLNLDFNYFYKFIKNNDKFEEEKKELLIKTLFLDNTSINLDNDQKKNEIPKDFLFFIKFSLQRENYLSNSNDSFFPENLDFNKRKSNNDINYKDQSEASNKKLKLSKNVQTSGIEPETSNLPS